MRKFIFKHLNKNDSLLKHSIIVFIGSTIVNILNYLYQLFMGRALGPSDYGTLGALFSILYIVTFSFGAIKTVVMKFTSKYYAKEDYGKIKGLFLKSMRILSLYGIMGLALFFIFSPLVAGFLNISEVNLLYLTGVFLLLSLISPVPIGVINGLQRFNTLNIVSVLSAFLKLGIGVAAVYMGGRLFGVFFALNLAQLLALVISVLVLAFLFKYKAEKDVEVKLFEYSVPVFVGLTVMYLFVNIDVLLVKHYFTFVEAGYYAAASIIGKIILFSSGALLVAMFPKVSLSHEKNEDSSKILKSTLFYTIIISGLPLILYCVMPTFISHLLFGKDYQISSYIGIFGLVIAIFSVSNVLVNYNLAIHKTYFTYLLFFLLAFEIIGIMIFHDTLLEVIQVTLVVNVIMVGYMLFITRKELGFNLI